MKFHGVQLCLSLLLSLICLAGCADETTTEVTELSVSQLVEVNFGSMAAGVAESATLNLDVLDTVPDLATNRERFQCAALHANDTRLTIRELEGEELEKSALSVIAQFRTQGDANWVPLATFESPAETASVLAPRPDSASEIDAQKLEVALLGQPTRMVLLLEASAADALEGLTVELGLSFFFSSDPGGCNPDAFTNESPQGDEASGLDDR